ncbi:MAG: DUF3370 domain-containing protein [Nostoc sp. DedVER02]|uniref:DUF3370 domain-containing protein n=1 Tax=unclassified Nostoc TaxID=2593658 RepID=UPI002AD428D8|nr:MULTISPECIES: DUF3370 domain-containing protein [unclassified Nostoc]MDZ7986084.1 DUF3370 domain-containing protein [Nostoc sp. DedVER02]MDZ8114292.1 DUF3370 domain-containing protein [Nostoc sp. DedVER01b]
MLNFISYLFLAQASPSPAPTPQEIFIPQQTRPLTGHLDEVPVFNSNNPEVVQSEGILLSTFPPQGKKVPSAHLNFPFQGRFDLFSHHIARAIETPNDLRTLYLGVIVYNPSDRPATVNILQAASYLSQPDAPFIKLPAMQSNNSGNIFAGPGDRVMNDMLRVRRQSGWPAQLLIPPKQSRMLMNHPIPVRSLTPPLNGRSTLLRLYSDRPVYLANLAMFAKPNTDGSERAPTLEEWENLLENGDFAGPREPAPSPPNHLEGAAEIYGRVAGVAVGSRWQVQVTDSNSSYLTIPESGQAFSYGLSTLLAGKMGTGQNQTAKLVARYPGTAYEAHGNYGIEYNISLPLINNTDKPQTIKVLFQTPIKEDELSKPGLRFFSPPQASVFFRGTVRIRYNDDNGLPRTQYWHLVQQRGQMGEPLAQLKISAGQQRLVQVDFLYPPDATPPQMLTIQTVDQT